MKLNQISIKQFKKQGLKNARYYKDDFIISNQLENVEQFKYPHRIDGITILVCINGIIDCSINLKKYRIEGNTILINFQENIIQIQHTEDLRAYSLVISSEYLDELQIDTQKRSDFYMMIKANPIVHIPDDEIGLLNHYYMMLVNSIDKSYPESQNMNKALVETLVYHIISLMKIFSDRKERKEKNPRAYLIFENFMTLLTKYHCQERRVSFYAEKMFLTPNYMSMCIQEYSGKTALAWINEFVTVEAKALLKFSEKSIVEISDFLNFPSQSTFGKYFKQQTGMGPKAYRNAISSEESSV